MTTQHIFSSRASSWILGLTVVALASTIAVGCSDDEDSSPSGSGGSETSSGGGETRTSTGETSSSSSSSGGGGTTASTCKTIDDCATLTCVCYGVSGEQVRKCVNGACGKTCADFDGCS